MKTIVPFLSNNADGAIIPEGFVASAGTEKIIGRRHEKQAQHRPVIFVEGKGHAPNGNPRLKIVNAVQRIEHPQVALVSVRIAIVQMRLTICLMIGELI